MLIWIPNAQCCSHSFRFLTRLRAGTVHDLDAGAQNARLFDATVDESRQPGAGEPVEREVDEILHTNRASELRMTCRNRQIEWALLYSVLMGGVGEHMKSRESSVSAETEMEEMGVKMVKRRAFGWS